MKTIGFAISGKENEKRRALLPHDIEKIKNPGMLYFESGYGEVLGFSNESYQRVGAKICSKDMVLIRYFLSLGQRLLSTIDDQFKI